MFASFLSSVRASSEVSEGLREEERTGSEEVGVDILEAMDILSLNVAKTPPAPPPFPGAIEKKLCEGQSSNDEKENLDEVLREAKLAEIKRYAIYIFC